MGCKHITCTIVSMDINGTCKNVPSSSYERTLQCRASVSVTSGGIAVPLANGNIMMIPVAENEQSGDGENNGDGINITEQINSSGVWTSLVGNTTSNKKQKNSER